MNGLARRSRYTVSVGESELTRCWPVLKTRLSVGTRPREKVAAWIAGTTISRHTTLIGAATMASPSAASRPRDIRLLTSRWGRRAGDLFVPLLVAIGAELWTERGAVGLGD